MKIIMNKVALIKICIVIFINLYSFSFAEKNIKLYFSNDSINGIKPSDAYETHNMGLIYGFDNNFFQLDLGLVTPDMFVYENQYREANRSYGELIRLTYGSKKFNDKDIKIYLNYIAQGKFGIDKLQNLAHNIANFQIETDILEKVRMPDSQWVGAGIYYQKNESLFKKINFAMLLKGYIGTDKSAFSIGTENILLESESSSASLISNLQYVPYDNIVSADPVNAIHRKLIPSLKLQYKYTYQNLTFTLYERISLPTIVSDNKPYLLFGASLEIPLDY